MSGLVNISDADLKELKLFEFYPDDLLQFAYAIYVLFACIGIPGSLITIVALATCKKFRNATAFFIINLQMCHLLICSVMLPMSAVIFSAKHWIYGKTMCLVYPLMKFGLSGTAHFTVIAITINRYIIVCHPHFYPKLYKKKYLIMSLVSTWVAGFILFVPAAFGLWGQYGLEQRGGSCTMIPDEHNINPKKILVALSFILPYSFITVCYSRIWWTVRKNAQKRRAHTDRAMKPNISDNELNSSSIEKGPFPSDLLSNESTTESESNNLNVPITSTPDGRNSTIINFFKKSFRIIKNPDKVHLPSKKDKKLATMIWAIILSFTLCNTPIMLIRVTYDYKSNVLVNILAHLLEYSAAFISPIIYVVMSSEYRQAYTSLYKDCKSAIMKYLNR